MLRKREREREEKESAKDEGTGEEREEREEKGEGRTRKERSTGKGELDESIRTSTTDNPKTRLTRETPSSQQTDSYHFITRKGKTGKAERERERERETRRTVDQPPPRKQHLPKDLPKPSQRSHELPSLC
jgi:hypothetical protein